MTRAKRQNDVPKVSEYTVKNWRKFQHYSHRNPPWIKLHYDMLTSRDWVMLADASKLTAVVCMLIASRNEGKIPNDPEYIRRMAHMDSAPDLNALIDVGFLGHGDAEDCSQVKTLADASACKQMQEFAPKSLSEKSRVEKSRVDLMSKQISEPNPTPLEVLRSAWKSAGLHKSERAGQGWSGSGVEKRIEALAAEHGISALSGAVSRYARKIQSRDDWKQFAEMFSTFFGQRKATFLEFLDGEEGEAIHDTPPTVPGLTPEEIASIEAAQRIHYRREFGDGMTPGTDAEDVALLIGRDREDILANYPDLKTGGDTPTQLPAPEALPPRHGQNSPLPEYPTDPEPEKPATPVFDEIPEEAIP